MTNANETAATIATVEASPDLKCPGCHFECRLARYQCGRGKEFFDIAAAGGEVPERRGPMLTPSERAATPDGKPPLDGRVMHGLNILAARFQQRRSEMPERRVLLTLERSGSFMSTPILSKRLQIEPEALDSILAGARDAGLVSVEVEPASGRTARLTAEGEAQAAAWKAEHEQENAEFLSPLSDEEKETLETLVRKLLFTRMGEKPMRRGPRKN